MPGVNSHFDVVLDKYLTWLVHNKGKSESTAHKYGGYIKQLQEWAVEQGLEYNDLDLDLIEQFTGPIAHQRKLSNASRRPLVAAIKGFYGYLRRAGELNNNPAADLPYPTPSFKLPVAISSSNAEKMLLTCDLSTFLGIRNAAVMSVFYGCGARLSGVCNLNESDLTFGIDHKNNERLMIKLREKGKKERIIPAPHETRLYILAYLGHPELKDINRSLPNGDKVLFVSTMNRQVPEHEYYGENRRLRRTSIANIFNNAGEKAGVPENQRNPHAARHLYGTEFTEHDQNILITQSLMGHAKVEATKIYTHIAERKKIDAVDQANPLSRMKTHMTDIAKRLNSTRHKDKPFSRGT